MSLKLPLPAASHPQIALAPSHPRAYLSQRKQRQPPVAISVSSSPSLARDPLHHYPALSITIPCTAHPSPLRLSLSPSASLSHAHRLSRQRIPLSQLDSHSQSSSCDIGAVLVQTSILLVENEGSEKSYAPFAAGTMKTCCLKLSLSGRYAQFRIKALPIFGKRYLTGCIYFTGANLALTLSASVLCVVFAPTAAGPGIPEVKAYLNGVNTPNMFGASTLIVKIESKLKKKFVKRVYAVRMQPT